MKIWLENVYSKNVVHETLCQIHKNMDIGITNFNDIDEFVSVTKREGQRK